MKSWNRKLRRAWESILAAVILAYVVVLLVGIAIADAMAGEHFSRRDNH